MHSYKFLKLYLCHLYSKNTSFPIISKNFICLLFQTVSFRKDKRGKPPTEDNREISNNLKLFYDLHYKSTNDINYHNLSATLAYESPILSSFGIECI